MYKMGPIFFTLILRMRDGAVVPLTARCLRFSRVVPFEGEAHFCTAVVTWKILSFRGNSVASRMSVYHDEVEIEDFEYDSDSEIYFYPCPCGDRFEITKVMFPSYGSFQVY